MRVAVAVDAVALAVVLLLGVNEGLRVFVADAVKVDFVWVRVIVKVGVPVDRVGDTVADVVAVDGVSDSVCVEEAVMLRVGDGVEVMVAVLVGVVSVTVDVTVRVCVTLTVADPLGWGGGGCDSKGGRA